MAVVAPASAPTLVDAERAARALVAEGAAMVLLFGSVARGTAGPHSDIDLVAVFDDLDYAARYDLKATLVGRAVRATLSDVDVIVTDRPEWRWRTTRVCSSLEAAIARDAVTLIDLGEGAVRWGKEIGSATTNEEEALDRLGDAMLHFISVRRNLRPDDPDDWPGAPLGGVDARTVERVRLRDLCAFAAQAIESTVKAFRAAAGGDGRLTHHIFPLLRQTGGHREALLAALAPVRASTIPDPRRDEHEAPADYPAFNDVGLMRTAGTYVSEVPGATFERLADLAPRMCRAAVAAAELATRRLTPASGPPQQVAQLAAIAAGVGAYLDAFPVVTGEPLRRPAADGGGAGVQEAPE